MHRARASEKAANETLLFRPPHFYICCSVNLPSVNRSLGLTRVGDVFVVAHHRPTTRKFARIALIAKKYFSLMFPEELLNSADTMVAIGHYMNALSAEERETPGTAIFEPPNSSILLSGEFSARIDSPVPVLAFSPTEKGSEWAQCRLVLNELWVSERAFVASLKNLVSYFLEPLVVRCKRRHVICLPLAILTEVTEYMIEKHSALCGQFRAGNVTAVIKWVHGLLQDSCYLKQMAYASLLLYLVRLREFPFEGELNLGGFLRFLEANQGASYHMDLSFVLLLHKPTMRVVKYKLFMLRLVELFPTSMDIRGGLNSVLQGLRKINEDSRTWREKEVYLSTMNISYLAAVGRCPQFYGPVRFCKKVWGMWMESSETGTFVPKTANFTVLVHDSFLALALQTQLTSRIWMLVALSCIGAHMPCSDRVEGMVARKTKGVCKIEAAVGVCRYEILVQFDSDVIALRFVSLAPDFPLPCKVQAVMPEIAMCDIDVNANGSIRRHGHMCYFRALQRVEFAAPQASLRHKISRFFRR